MLLWISSPPPVPRIGRPWSLSGRSLEKILSLLVMIMPPCPVEIVLLAEKEKHPRSPMAPRNLLPCLEVSASAASSITKRLCFLAILIMASMSAPLPVTCTGTIALVLTLIAFLMASIEMVRSAGFTSTNTGFAPQRYTALAVAIKVRSGTITSSPYPTSKALSAKKIAAVPLVVAEAYLAPTNLAILFSN